MKKKLLILLLALNIFLISLSMICFVGTYFNNRAVNSAVLDYEYCENGSGEVLMSLDSERTVRLRFRKNSVWIAKSYEVNSREDIFAVILFVRRYAAEHGQVISRANIELYGEFRLHNMLYACGIERSRTSDLDLDFVQDRRWYVNAASYAIGRSGL